MIKKILLIFISFLPFNYLRILFYRKLLKYNISKSSYIGPLNYIYAEKVSLSNVVIKYLNILKCNNLQIEDSSILYFNIFLRLNSVIIGPKSKIGRSNIFLATKENVSPFKDSENLFLGEKVIITKKHFFDFANTIEMGNDVTFAGEGIQTWTHGFDLDHVMVTAPIKIGNKVYIGSSSIINPGITICDRVSVGAGTVISKSITESGFYVSSNLIKKSENKYFKSHSNTIMHNGGYFHSKI